jgi:hypothetical protein
MPAFHRAVSERFEAVVIDELAARIGERRTEVDDHNVPRPLPYRPSGEASA